MAVPLIRRRRWSLALLAAAVGLVLVWAVGRALGPDVEPPHVVVQEFRNGTGEPDWDWMGWAAADLVARSLASALPAIPAQVGGRLSKGAVAVEGEILGRGGRLVVRARVRRQGGDGPAGVEGAGSSRSDFFGAVEALLDRLPPLLAEGSRPARPLFGEHAVTRNDAAYEALARGRVLAVGRPSDALVAYRRAVTLDPSFALAHLHVFLVAQAGFGSRAEAEAALRLALSHRQRLTPVERSLVEVTAAAAGLDGRPRDERPLLAHIRANPDSRDGYVVAGRLFSEHRGRVFEAWVRAMPGDAAAHNMLAYHYALALGDYPGAEREARTVVRLLPDDPNSYDTLGDVLNFAGRPAEALDAFQRALALDPSFLPSDVKVVRTLILLDELPRARERVQGILVQIDPASRYWHTAVALVAAIDWLGEGATAALARLDALARSPGVGARAYVPLGYAAVLEAMRGRPDRARALAREAEALGARYHGRTGHASNLEQYVAALASFENGDPSLTDWARAHLSRDGTSTPGDAQAAIVDALASWHEGDPDAVVRRLDDIGDPRTSGWGFYARLLRARALVRAGRPSEAATAWTEALRLRDLNPENAEAVAGWRACLQEAARLARERGDASQARALESRLARLGDPGHGDRATGSGQ